VIPDPLRDFLIHAKIEGKELDEVLKIFNDNAVAGCTCIAGVDPKDECRWLGF
jgi:ribosomal protein L12E/L44/L45/RPP1/RPP2